MSEIDSVGLENAIHSLLPLVKAVEFRIEKAEPGRVESHMLRHPLIVNHFGAFHAGALYTFAESAAAAVLMASFDLSNLTVVNKRGEIRYLKAVREKAVSIASLPPEVIAKANEEVAAAGRAEFPFPLEVLNEKDEMAAKVEFDFYLRKTV